MVASRRMKGSTNADIPNRKLVRITCNLISFKVTGSKVRVSSRTKGEGMGAPVKSVKRKT